MRGSVPARPPDRAPLGPMDPAQAARSLRLDANVVIRSISALCVLK